MGIQLFYYETSSGQLVRQAAAGTQRILSAERVTATYPSTCNYNTSYYK